MSVLLLADLSMNGSWRVIVGNSPTAESKTQFSRCQLCFVGCSLRPSQALRDFRVCQFVDQFSDNLLFMLSGLGVPLMALAVINKLGLNFRAAECAFFKNTFWTLYGSTLLAR